MSLAHSRITNQSENFFSSITFETQIHVVNISVALNQSKLWNPPIELKSLPTPVLDCQNKSCLDHFALCFSFVKKSRAYC